MTPTEWSKSQQKSKVPKPKLEGTEEGQAAIEVLVAVIKARLNKYARPLVELLGALERGEVIDLNERNAAVVSVGEQRVLWKARAMFLAVRQTIRGAVKRPTQSSEGRGEAKRRKLAE